MVFWKFDRLKGSENYQQWASHVKALSNRKRTWGLLTGTETRPVTPDLPTATDGGEALSAVAERVKQLEAVRESQAKWDQKNDDAWDMLRKKIDKSIWHDFASLERAPEIWRLAEEKFGQEDATAVDNEVAALCLSDASKFKSVQEYYDYITMHNNRLIEMKKNLPDWFLSSIFRTGLTVDQAPYIFYLIEAANREKRELSLDEMAAALIQQERRMNIP